MFANLVGGLNVEDRDERIQDFKTKLRFQLTPRIVRESTMHVACARIGTRVYVRRFSNIPSLTVSFIRSQSICPCVLSTNRRIRTHGK
jgi:hypothetical protein